MSTQEFSMEEPAISAGQRRVVEAEIRLPRWEELGLPKWEELKAELEPVRTVAADVLLTGLGIGVLMVRGVAAAVRAAHEAGVEAAEHPGPVTKALLGLFRKEKGAAEAPTTKVSVPVLPVNNYDSLTTDEAIAQMAALSEAQLRVLREYEAGHANRAEVLAAIDRRLVVS